MKKNGQRFSIVENRSLETINMAVIVVVVRFCERLGVSVSKHESFVGRKSRRSRSPPVAV